MEIELKIEDVRQLWDYHKDISLIAEESKKSEEPEVAIMHFVANAGLDHFCANVLLPLNLPTQALAIFEDAISTLKKHVTQKSNYKFIISSFEHFYKLVKMLTENVCYSDGITRTANWKETL